MRKSYEIVKDHPTSLSLDPTKITAAEVTQQMREKKNILQANRDALYDKIRASQPQPPQLPTMCIDTTDTSTPTFHVPTNAPPDPAQELEAILAHKTLEIFHNDCPTNAKPLPCPQSPITTNDMRQDAYIQSIEDKLGSLNDVDMVNLLCYCTDAYQEMGFSALPPDVQTTLIFVGLARKPRTEDNPTFHSVMKDPALREIWLPPIKV